MAAPAVRREIWAGGNRMTPRAEHGCDGARPAIRLHGRGPSRLIVAAPFVLSGGAAVGLGCCFGPAGLAVGAYGLLLAAVAGVVMVRHVSRSEG